MLSYSHKTTEFVKIPRITLRRYSQTKLFKNAQTITSNPQSFRNKIVNVSKLSPSQYTSFKRRAKIQNTEIETTTTIKPKSPNQSTQESIPKSPNETKTFITEADKSKYFDQIQTQILSETNNKSFNRSKLKSKWKSKFELNNIKDKLFMDEHCCINGKGYYDRKYMTLYEQSKNIQNISDVQVLRQNTKLEAIFHKRHPNIDKPNQPKVLHEHWSLYFAVDSDDSGFEHLEGGKSLAQPLFSEPETWNIIAHINKRHSYGKSLRYSDRFYRNWAIKTARQLEELSQQHKLHPRHQTVGQ